MKRLLALPLILLVLMGCETPNDTVVYHWPYRENCVEVRQNWTTPTIKQGVYCKVEVQ